MAVANAPMPLANQIRSNANISISLPLRGIGAPPTFGDGGTAFNSGDPTMTVTIATQGGSAAGSAGWDQLVDLIEGMIREGSATAS